MYRMKIKQKNNFRMISPIGRLIVGALFLFSFTVGLLPAVPTASAATGACSKNASYSDPCMKTNYDKAKAEGSTLTETEFINLVHECEGRDSAGANIGTRFDSQSGNCSNAIASCYSKINDQRACKDDTVLAYGSEINNGEIDAEDWGKAIEFHNRHTGGDDYATNASLRNDRLDNFKNQNANACEGLPVDQIDACQDRLEAAFNACYDQLGGAGGTEKKVNQSALDSCIKDKRISGAQNQVECEKAGGQWNGTIGPVQGSRCTPKPSSNPNDPNNPNNGVNGGQGGTGGTTQTENCGTAKTNLIKCSGSGVQAIGDVLRQIIVILTIIIGIAAVGGIGYAAILYAGATDNASQTQSAINIIRNIVIGILVYGFMIAIINWLVPGSVIG